MRREVSSSEAHPLAEEREKERLIGTVALSLPVPTDVG